MKHAILNSDDFCGWRFENQGDLAIVIESPYANLNGPDPLPKATWDKMREMDIQSRLASVHVICPFYTDRLSGYNKRELRYGWSRVLAELSFIPSVKRILVMCQKTPCMDAVLGFHVDYGLQNSHGTIFTLHNGLEVVFTWQRSLPFMSEWKARDIERWKYLVKDNPLPYHHSLKGLKSHHKKIVVDLETAGPEKSDALNPLKGWMTVLGVQWSDTDRAYISGNDNVQWCIKRLCDQVRNGAHIYFHNAQFDLGFMGQEFRDTVVEYDAVHCTMIRARARGELVNTLKHLGNFYTNRPGNYAFNQEGDEHEFIDPRYVCEDLHTTWELSNLYSSDGNKPVVQQFERCIVMAAEQSLLGTFVKPDLLDELHTKVIEDIEFWKADCIREFGVDPGKSQQLGPVLVEHGYELRDRTKSGKFYKLDDEILEEFGLTNVLNYRRATKLKSTFIGKLKAMVRPDNTVHHRQTMLGADTGRTTMSDFNWQQASKKGTVRDVVQSRFAGGQILIVDLAQAELRVLAYVSNDEIFAELFEKEDPHLSNASRAFNIPEVEVTEELRFDAKAVIFKVVYGGKAITPGQKRVERFYRSAFRKAFLWIDAIAMLAKMKGEVTDAYGKTRNLKEVEVYRGLSGVARAGINSPIQGTASHIAMQVTYNAWRLFKKYKLRSLVLFGVHDSVVCDVHPEEVELVKKLVRIAFAQLRESHMFKAFPLAQKLPICGELLIGESWGWIDKNKKAIIKANQHVMCSSLDTITEDSLCIA